MVALNINRCTVRRAHHRDVLLVDAVVHVPIGSDADRNDRVGGRRPDERVSLQTTAYSFYIMSNTQVLRTLGGSRFSYTRDT